MDGISLDALIRRERYLSNDAAMLILYEVCKALKYAHDKQVIHRDIKPGNILISRQGEVKLVDFGIATSAEETEDGLTRDGMVLGTPAYIPPEQIDDARNVDRRADIYSLGVVLYEMLTGRTPFPGTFTAETIALIQRGRYTPPRRLNPQASRRCCARSSRKCMRVKPRRRYQDLKAIIRLLERRIQRRDPAAIRQAMKKVLAGEEIRELFRAAGPGSARLVAGAGSWSCWLPGGFYLYRQGYYFEYLAPERYGALVVSAQVSTRYKEPCGDLHQARALPGGRRASSPGWRASTGTSGRTAPAAARSCFILESRKLYLPAGQYRLKFSLEGELYWESFYLNPAHGPAPATWPPPRPRRSPCTLGQGSPLPLEVEHAAYDVDTGEDLTASTDLLRVPGGALAAVEPAGCDADLRRPATASASRGKATSRGPTAWSSSPTRPSCAWRPSSSRCPGTLRLQSNAAGLKLRLDGSEHYFTGGRQRAVPPPGAPAGRDPGALPEARATTRCPSRPTGPWPAA